MTNSQEKTLKLHPLAIIGISDHYTRISTGGSVLPPTSATIGLLFGHKETFSNECIITIIDAEEVETSPDPSTSTLTALQMTHIQTKIELHQKVFPQHQVVGWYKVIQGTTTNEEEDGALPTPHDINIHNGWMREFNPQPVFLLMDSSERKSYQNKAGNTDGEDAREKLDRDEELPIALYEIMNGTGDGGSGSAFVNLEFGLETFGPERIAVEKVFRTKPKALTNPSTSIGADVQTTSSTADSKPAPAPAPAPATSEHTNTPQITEAELHIQSLVKSVDAMNARVAILLDFLHKTKDGSIEPNHELLRQVMSLVKQLPLVMGRTILNDDGSGSNVNANSNSTSGEIGKEYENQHGDVLVMSYLAALAKTTKSVITYSEKFRLMEESVSSDAVKRPYGRHGHNPRGDANVPMHMGMYMD